MSNDAACVIIPKEVSGGQKVAGLDRKKWIENGERAYDLISGRTLL